ncbi:MAG: hypothetical protein KDB27_30220, partial [Planctomycetales bacterium]|nr:hypothetical protein [Planctomycetales bacterium]
MLNRFALSLLATLLVSNAFAQLPNPVLTDVFPRGAQIGTSVDVTISGRDVDEPTKLIFTHPGIQGQVKRTAATEFEVAKNSSNQFSVQVAENVPPGIYEARSVGRFGVSTPLPFVIHRQAQAVEAGDNHAPEKATPVLLPSVVFGRADGNQTDYYKISVENESTISIRCLGSELISRIEPVVSILQLNGRPLKRSRTVRDTTLTHTFAKGGEYLVAIHDGVYGGGGDYPYALQITNQSVIDMVLPVAGVPGEITEFTFYGRNLVGGQDSPYEIDKHRLSMFTRKIYVPTAQELLQSYTSVGGLRSLSYRHGLDDDVASGVEASIGLAAAPVMVEA